MKCSICGLDTDVTDSRTLTTDDNISFVRRLRYCKKKHQTITHEIYTDGSPIPDIYRLKRVRKPIKKKPKKKPKKKDAWLKNVLAKLDSDE
jgi:transcriptional regulator NrdR family protein